MTPRPFTLEDLRGLCASTAGDGLTFDITLGQLRSIVAEVQREEDALIARTSTDTVRAMTAPPGLRSFTDAQVRDAIRQEKGCVSKAARALGPGVTAHGLTWRIRRHPEVWPEGVVPRTRRPRKPEAAP